MTLAQAEVGWGLDIFGTSNPGDDYLTRAAGDGEFLKLYLDLTHIRPLPWKGGQMRLDLTAQLADRKLLSNEEFALGGTRIGRGYDGSEITGDQGVGFGIEIGQRLPYDLQAFGYYDIGMLANKSGGRESLASAGAGLRTEFNKYASGQFEIGVPLTRPISAYSSGKEKEWRAFFSFTLRY